MGRFAGLCGAKSKLLAVQNELTGLRDRRMSSVCFHELSADAAAFDYDKHCGRGIPFDCRGRHDSTE